MKCLFAKDSLQWLFSKKGNEPDRSKLEEIGKTHTRKTAKEFKKFFGLSNFVKRFIFINYSMLKYTHTSLHRTLTKRSRF